MKIRVGLGILLLAAGSAVGIAQKAAVANTTPNPDANGIYHPGDGIAAPVPIELHDPEMPKQLHNMKKMKGKAVVEMTIDTEGKPQDVHVVHSLGVGLTGDSQQQALAYDQKAMEAVKMYRFRPATYKGKPVPVRLSVSVTFN